MRIAYNPSGAGALKSAPDNDDITFDIPGQSIYALGTQFKGTSYELQGEVVDDGYKIKLIQSVGDSYSISVPVIKGENSPKFGLVPAPTSTEGFLKGDGTWVVPQLSSNNIYLDESYTIAKEALSLGDKDSLTNALGKLEYKLDVAYGLVTNANDSDGTIENLKEIFDVLKDIKDTETIQDIISGFPGVNKVGTVTSVALKEGIGVAITGGTITDKGEFEISNTGVISITPGDNIITVNTGGTSENITIPYATTATNLTGNPVITDNQDNTIKITVGSKNSNNFTVPYATTAAKLSEKPTLNATESKIQVTVGGQTSDTFEVPYAVSATNLLNAPTLQGDKEITVTVGGKTSEGFTVPYATNASRITTDAGSDTTPVYFKDGVPNECSFTVKTSVPENALFTDTTYTFEGGTNSFKFKSRYETDETTVDIIPHIENNVTYSNPANGYVAIFDGDEGVIKSSGYTIEASVPPNANFKDTWKLNTKDSEGYVAKPSDESTGMVWKVDTEGNPTWDLESVRSVSVTSKLDNGVHIGSVEVNGNNTNLYAPTPTTYSFAGGENKFTVTPSIGNSYDVQITPIIAKNVTYSHSEKNQVVIFGDGGIITNSGYYIHSTVPENAKFTDTWNQNSKGCDGYVLGPGDEDIDKVWKTDAEGNPGWRDEKVTIVSVEQSITEGHKIGSIEVNGSPTELFAPITPNNVTYAGNTNANTVVIFNGDSGTITSSGFTIGKSVPDWADFTNTWRGITDAYNPETTNSEISLSQTGAKQLYWDLFNQLNDGHADEARYAVTAGTAETAKKLIGIDFSTEVVTEGRGNIAVWVGDKICQVPEDILYAGTATNLLSAPSLNAVGDNITVTAGNKTSSEFTVPYATTATNLSNAPSLSIDGNTIAVTAGGATSSYITVPYATSAGSIDGTISIDNGANPNTIEINVGNRVSADFIVPYATNADNCTHGSFGSASIKSWTTTVASNSTNLITSGAVHAYAPAKDGTGAYGNWNITATNANYATTAEWTEIAGTLNGCTIHLTGDVEGSAAFNGTSELYISTTCYNSGGGGGYIGTTPVNSYQDYGQGITGVGSISYSGIFYISSTNFSVDNSGAYHTSDIRKKTNITKARNLDIADLLVEFDWKESGKHSWGYIAQDLLTVLPEAVNYNKDVDMYSVNYNVAHSAAIASLTARIKELEEKLKKHGIQ